MEVRARTFRIRNAVTGAYLLRSMNEPLEFYNRGDAYIYLRKHNLNLENFYVIEFVKIVKRGATK